MTDPALPRLAALSQLGVVRVSGADARTFLQGQLTADVRRVSPTQGTLAAWCNPQGRALFLGFLLQRGEDFLWLLPATDIERCVKRLRMYVLRAKATVEDLRGQWGVVGELLSARSDAPPFHCSQQDGLCRLVLPGSALALLAGPIGDAEARVATSGSAELQEHEWDLAALRSGIPRVEGPTAERFIPQQLNLDQLGVMSFDKGCYAGQEVIARLKYRGQVRQRLRVGAAREPLLAGQRLYRADAQASQSAGEVLQVLSAGDSWFCTAVIDVDSNEPLSAGSPGGSPVEFEPPAGG